jgi:hypothetical protein
MAMPEPKLWDVGYVASAVEVPNDNGDSRVERKGAAPATREYRFSCWY